MVKRLMSMLRVILYLIYYLDKKEDEYYKEEIQTQIV